MSDDRGKPARDGAHTVFRGYDQARLDYEYNNRDKIPDSADWVERYAAESAATREALPCIRDVPYGPGEFETLDIFPARGVDAGAPVQLFVHGGYWRALYKESASYVARSFSPYGAITVVINYALIPSVDMDELVRQCRASLAWTHENIERYGGDPSRIFVSGHSAGAHVAAMMMATDWAGFGPGGAPVPVAGAVGISGLYDLEPIRLSAINRELGLTPESAARNSPVGLRPQPGGRLLLTVGRDEGPEYLRQTWAQAAAWSGLGPDVDVEVAPGHHHFSIGMELAEPESPLARAMRLQMSL